MTWPFRPVDTVLLKTASRCNLDCEYCYVYHMGDDSWKRQPKRMSPEVIAGTIDQLGSLAAAQGTPFSVVMHGGEPLLLGIEATRLLVEGLRHLLPITCGIHVQTNGLLLSDPFIDLFAEFDVGVSISFDGPALVHDRWRGDRRGKGSHRRVSDAIERLRSHPSGTKLFSGVLAVVDPVSDPVETYHALKATGAPGFDLLYRDGNRTKLPYGKSSLESLEFGRWMLSLLHVYLEDQTPPRIRFLDDMMRLLLGGAAYKEGVGLTDFGILVIDTDGTVTKNDTLKVALAEGDKFRKPISIVDHDLLAYLASPEYEEYHAMQKPTSATCLSCPELSICGGGMTAHRWSEADGYDNPTVFCADQKFLIGEIRRIIGVAQAA